MSTRFSKSKTTDNSIDSGYEGENVPHNFSLPSCTVEDVDRALFDLFNNEIPFYYQIEKESRKIPVIFATGERFAILRRRRPLRDKAGALILPLVSMIRTGVSQDVSKGLGPGEGPSPLVIKRRLDSTDPMYQRLVNKQALLNQNNTSSPNHFSNAKKNRAKPGQVAVQGASEETSIDTRLGALLKSDLDSKNIYEVITIPPTKFFTANYEITFWTQYTQQMNDMISAVMSSYHDMRKRTFKIETKKGYWFVAYTSSDLSSNSNFDDFSDDERVIKYTFTMEVNGYLINPSYPGAPNALRSFTSPTHISFDVLKVNGDLVTKNVGRSSGDPADYVLQDFETDENSDKTVNVGGASAGDEAVEGETIEVNPFTGKKYPQPLIRQFVTPKGETTYRNMNDGEVVPGLNELVEIDI